MLFLWREPTVNMFSFPRGCQVSVPLRRSLGLSRSSRLCLFRCVGSARSRANQRPRMTQAFSVTHTRTDLSFVQHLCRTRGSVRHDVAESSSSFSTVRAARTSRVTPGMIHRARNIRIRRKDTPSGRSEDPRWLTRSDYNGRSMGRYFFEGEKKMEKK